MNQKSIRIIYWGSTGLLAFFMFALSVAYFTVPLFKEAFLHLGFPDYFRWIVGTAKGLGAIALIAKVPERIKTFAYDGFAIMFVCGAIAHLAAGDPFSKASGALVGLILLVVSGISRSKI